MVDNTKQNQNIFKVYQPHSTIQHILTIIIINMKVLLHHYSRSQNNIIESYHLRFRSWCFDCLVLVFIRWCGQLVNFVSKCLSAIDCEQYSSRPRWKQFASETTYCTYNTQSQAIIVIYIITQVIIALWLVLAYDLLEDRCIDEDWALDSFFFTFFEFWIWTNHNSLLSIATNQFASSCIDIRSRQC